MRNKNTHPTFINSFSQVRQIFHKIVLKKTNNSVSTWKRREQQAGRRLLPGWRSDWVWGSLLRLRWGWNWENHWLHRPAASWPSGAWTSSSSRSERRLELIELWSGSPSWEIYTSSWLFCPHPLITKQTQWCCSSVDKMYLIKTVVSEEILWTEPTIWFLFRWGKKEIRVTFAADLMTEYQEWTKLLWNFVLIN